MLLTVHDDKSGKFVTDLQPSDFRVVEDGVLQQITNFTKQTGLPLTIALAVDTSSSVKLNAIVPLPVKPSSGALSPEFVFASFGPGWKA